MLLAIRFNEKKVIHKEDGLVVLDLGNYDLYAEGVNLFTTKGHTKSDFDKNKATCGRSIVVANNGKIEDDEKFQFCDTPEDKN